MQLVILGEQDKYLTGNPQITFFKVVYRRHTNFSIECVQQRYISNENNDENLNNIEQFRWKINKNGDLLEKLYLNMTLDVNYYNDENTDTDTWPKPCKIEDIDTSITGLDNNFEVIWNPTHNLIDNISCNIGGIKYDEHTGQWLEIYSQLNELNNTGKVGNIASMEATKFQKMSKSGGMCHYKGKSIFLDKDINNTVKFDAYVPLRFWFNKYVGLALPLISLQYHDVDIILDINQDCLVNENFNGNGGINIYNMELWANYIFLDADERKRFANSTHEYLIDQVQHNNFKGTTCENFMPLSYLDIKFNHPIKELIWTAKYDKQTGYQEPLMGESYDKNNDNYYYDNPIRYELKLNGLSRFSERKLEYFTQQQIYDYHIGKPVPTPSKFIYDKKNKNFDRISNNWTNNTIAVYSFALRPFEHQPSGTCNFSRIDDAELFINHVDSSDDIDISKNCDNKTRYVTNEYNVYALNYNVLRIMSGMSGLVYSN